MSPKHSRFITVDHQGRLRLPPESAARLHAAPGRRLPFTQDTNGLHLGLPEDDLARVYIEPTNQCNFDCRICMRNSWEEPPGQMRAETFERILAGLAAFRPTPLVFFGGFGEPLSHPDIVLMVRRAKALNAKTELITNGSLLNETMAEALIQAGLDRLWVSIDGSTPESYADVRLGDALPDVIANLEGLRQLRLRAGASAPRMGIAFVAMRRNISDLPGVIRLGRRLGADRFSISNVIAHTPEMREEVLYSRSYYDADQPVSEWAPLVQLPRMEINDQTRLPLAEALQGRLNISAVGQALHMGSSRCPFMEKRSLSIRWDGAVSPCLPLLHTHTTYLDQTERKVHAFSFGSVQDRALREIWESESCYQLRERLLSFDFSPCVFCNSCDMAEHNQEDCFGNTAPTCGGCLWAQGFIQCP